MSRHFYKTSLWTVFAVATLLSSACSSDDSSGQPAPAVDRQPVVFAVHVADATSAMTRTSQNVIGITELQGPSGGFGVFGCYTGLHKYYDVDAQPDFMYNEHVTWNGSAWIYSPLKYWPNGEGAVDGNTGEAPHYVSFMAYAPYSDMSTGDAGYCISSMSYQHELGNPWITYRLHPDVEHQVDLLCADPLLNQSKQTTAQAIPLHFRHALACAASTLTVKCSDVMKQNLINRIGTDVDKVEVILEAFSITYSLTSKGRMVLWYNGIPHWEAIASESALVTRKIDYAPSNYLLYSYNGTSTLGDTFTDDTHGIFYIPIHLANHYQTAAIDLTYKVIRYTKADPTTPIIERTKLPTTMLTLSDYTSYEAGKNLEMNFNIHDNTLHLDAAITDWSNQTVGNFDAVD